MRIASRLLAPVAGEGRGDRVGIEVGDGVANVNNVRFTRREQLFAEASLR